MKRSSLCVYLITTVYLITIVASAQCLAIGSGGLLNLVPQAEVWKIESDKVTQRLLDYRVYVHPMEGSLVLISDKSNVVLALDKNKRHAITMNLRDIKVDSEGRMIDVPENAPYAVIKGVPEFNRTYAALSMDDESTMLVKVLR